MTGNELIVDYLTSVPAWYLATVEDTPEGAQPHVRPFSFAALQDGEIQFCTATTKDCYREMQANPRVELTAWKPGRGWITCGAARTWKTAPARRFARRASSTWSPSARTGMMRLIRASPSSPSTTPRRGSATSTAPGTPSSCRGPAHHFVDIRRIARGRPLDAVQSHP